MNAYLNRWLARVPALLSPLSSLLPWSCALCGGKARHALCAGCEAQFFGAPPMRCKRCASPLPHAAAGGADCGDCLDRAPRFDATLVATDYTAPVDRLVLALKFGGQLALAPLFARLLRQASMGAALPTLLVAVPLGERRLAERGFNQAMEIARPLARALGVPLAPALLRRVRETNAQARLPPDERHRNIRGAFEVPPAALARVRGAHIGVVDDVITTGETLGEIATTLKRAGAARVTNLVFARTAAR